MRGRESRKVPLAVLLIFTFLGSILAIMPTPAFAQVGCGDVIMTNTTLTHNIGPCSGSGLTIGANDVTLNCAGYTVSGTGVGDGVRIGTLGVGVGFVTVKNCNVTGFVNGFFAYNSTHAILSGNIASFNRAAGNSTGFVVVFSNYDNLTRDTANNNYFGFVSGNTVYDNITANTASNNTYSGFLFYKSSDSIIIGNTANNDSNYGFDVSSSYGLAFSTNTASYNTPYGYGDLTIGDDTAGTGNIYTKDVCYGNSLGGSNKTGLCTVLSTFTTGEAASLVIGQPGFTSVSKGTSAIQLYYPRGAAFDSKGDLWVPDAYNNRILEFVPPFSDGMSASLVLGQSSFTTSATGTSQNTLDAPRAIAFDSSGDLWVADTGNSRILEFVPPFTNDMSASLVIGQTSFTGGSCATICTPFGLAFDSSGNLWVASSGNSEVLEFTSPSTAAFSTTPNLVISSWTGGPTCPPRVPSRPLTCNELVGPTGVAFAPNGDLYVIDAGNNRTLGFAAPFKTNELPTVFLGQAGYGTVSCNTTQSGLCFPTGVAFDRAGNMWIADSGNNRLVEYEGPNFTTGMSASVVIGQPNFTSSAFGTAQRGLALSTDRLGPDWTECVTAPSFSPDGALWMGDCFNNRILEYKLTIKSTPLSDGSATVSQTSETGASVTVTGSTAASGTGVTVSTQLLGTTQPPGTGSVSLSSTVFYDVQVQGISTGTAEVCITTASVTSGAVMQYWDGTAWVNAADITWTEGTNQITVCGDMPVSELNGTPVVVGGGHVEGLWVVTVTATLSSSTIRVGGSVTDSAVLQGDMDDAGGTVTYEYFTGSACIGTAITVGSPVTVTNGTAPGSAPQTFGAAGSYSWNAVYSGDENNKGATSGCEPLVVPAPSVFLSPSSGAPGTSVTITGTGLVASHSLTVSYDGSTAGMPTTCTTDASYNVSSGCTFRVPTSAVGPHTITVSDGTSSPTATFTVTLLGVTCSRSSMIVGEAAMCRAMVHESGTAAPTGTVAWSSSGPGTFSSASCTLSHVAHATYSTCSVMFTPTATGSSVVLTASYAGDSENPASSGGYTMAVTIMASKTIVSCTPKSAVAGSQTVITCKADVIGYAPSGTVSWSKSGTGSVYLASTTCTLSLGTCSVKMTGNTAGKVSVEWAYSGDTNNKASFGTVKLTIQKALTVTTMSCTSSPPIICTATVSSGYPTPTGTITWSKVSGPGSVTFSSETCTRSSGTLTCSVTITATKTGTIEIKAAYSGDSNDFSSLVQHRETD